MWPSDAPQAVEANFLELRWAQVWFRPRHRLWAFDIPHHSQLTLWPTMHPADAITIFSTNEQRNRDALTLKFGHLFLLSLLIDNFLRPDISNFPLPRKGKDGF